MTSPNASTEISPYTTSYYAEFYDLWCDQHVVGPHAADEEVYWRAIHSAIANRGTSSHSINVLEIGTGSGRCLKDLFDRSRTTGTPFPNTHFFALDPSAPMLDRGRAFFDARPEIKAVAPVTWIEGLAEDMITKKPELKGACDVVMWTGGGFSHLTSLQQQRDFLGQVKLALRDENAVGIVLVYDQSLPSRYKEGASEVFEVEWEGRSGEQPDLVYKKTRNMVSWEGSVRRDRWEIMMVREGKEVHRERVDHTLMNLDEEKWPGLVKDAVLRIDRTEELEGMGLFFFLKHDN